MVWFLTICQLHSSKSLIFYIGDAGPISIQNSELLLNQGYTTLQFEVLATVLLAF